jgi:hypothetical protein
MSYALGQAADSALKEQTAFAEQTSLTEFSDGSIEVSSPKVVVSAQYRGQFSVYTQQGTNPPYIVVSRADAQARGVPILADPWAAYQAGQKLPAPMAAQVKASGVPIPQAGKRWIPWALVGGGLAVALGLVLMVSFKSMKPNRRRRRRLRENMSRRVPYDSKPVTKHGKHGTMYLYEIEFEEDERDDGRPEWMRRWQTYAYDQEHAIESFYESYDRSNPGASLDLPVKVVSAKRVMRRQ